MHGGYDAILDALIEGAGKNGVSHRTATFVATLLQDSQAGQVAEDIVGVAGDPNNGLILAGNFFLES